jgi:hypothetical protein
MTEFLSSPNIPTMKIEHEDTRRTIREVALMQEDGSLRRVTSIEVKAPEYGEEVVLGNHTHNRPEDFVILSGDPKLLTAPPENLENISEHAFPNGGFITIDADVAHSFIFNKPGEIRSTMVGTFDESGTEPHKLA